MTGKTILKGLLPVAMAAVIVLAGCSSVKAVPTSGTTTSAATVSAGVKSSDATRYKAAWITPVVIGSSLSIPVATIDQDKIVHFWMDTATGKEAFMAYNLDGTIYMRGNICVPCRSYDYSLQKGILVCDTCGTTFNAKTTAKGTSGACVNYPKEPVTFQVQGGNVVATLADLDSAYQNTLVRKP
jgi:Membrane iron-sulfur containing protein FtrD-like